MRDYNTSTTLNKTKGEKKMDRHRCIKNRDIPDSVSARLEELCGDDIILFVISGDLSKEEKYSDTALAFSEKRIYSVGSDTAQVIEISDVEKLAVKRMYGNARMTATMKNGKKEVLFRYTYTVSALCDSAVQFVNDINGGTAVDEAFEAVKATFEKKLSVCPKCGRTLLHPGAECIQCQSKSKILSKLVKYILPQKNLLIAGILMSVVTTFIALMPPYYSQKLVDTILPNQDMAQLGQVVLILFVAYIVHYGLAAVRGITLRVAGDRIVESLRNDVYQKAQSLPMKFYDKTSTGSVMNRISSDTLTIQQFILRITQEAIVQVFLFVGIIIIMFATDPKLSLVALVPVPLVVVGSRMFSRKIAPYYKRNWRRWSAVTSVLTDTIPCIRVIKAFAGEKRAEQRFAKYNREWYNTSVRSAKWTASYPNVVNFFVTCGTLLIWAVGGKWVIESNGVSPTAGTLVAFLSYTAIFYQPINFFANLSDAYQGALSSTERILDILDAEPEEDFGKGNCPENIKGKIEFKNVNFSFDKTKKTLCDINLTVEPGDIVGIVGTTGSGKSTLINLLMRFYDNYEGDILLDGQNIKLIDKQYFRSKIGYVQQEPMMFSDTIYNNIAYGVPGAHVEQVIHAADVANAHEFIINQPDGYDSMLGERGVGLSGGEKQRLSIARAVLKNPSILIFDEATAAVDSETEELIQEAIERLISGRTTLMIAHRLSTLRKANKIIVVDKGRIIECGTHDELMALGGKYHKLIEIQSMSEKIRRSKQTENFG